MGGSRDPIAIVGAACRLPGGVDSLDALRATLVARGDHVGTIPEDRWDAEALYHPDYRKRGAVHTTRAAFLERVDLFDAAFFGISPNEARAMDPHQRIVLETTFDALEDAGIPLEAIAGKRVAVYVGCGNHDYEALQGTDLVLVGPTTNTGVAASIVANRVSYLFDLKGPSVTMDTACSSSLTTVHFACHAIWEHGCEAAIAGGVNVILRPDSTVGFSKGGYLSPDGECRAFSAHANGYVRGEGAGMVVLKPLARALADGDRVHGVIRGTWLNQDGHSQGMTAPDPDAQEALLRDAWASAGIDPTRASYIEAHGTGTPVGDPIEATAIGKVVGRGRRDVCFVGSVKTNIGHLETASGVAGLLKAMLVLRERNVFPNNHFAAPNPAIPFEQLTIRVPTENVPLPADGPLYAGVNSFGFGGANAHVVLESPPPQAAPAEAGDTALIVLSARSEAALKERATATAAFLRETITPLAPVASTLSRRRSAMEHRVAIGGTREALAQALTAFGAGESSPCTTGRVQAAPKAPVFVYSGQGPQWWAMGRQLLASDPVFAAAIRRVGAVLAELGWGDLEAELGRSEERSRIGETRIAQPALFALQYGLTEVLQAHGVVPGIVVGHSIGELCAALTAGILDLPVAARIVVARSRAQAQAEGKGAMAAVGLSEAEIAPKLRAGRVELAAVNGPRSVTVAGTHEGVAALEVELVAAEIFFRRLDVSVPFHCFLMDPVEDAFRREAGEVRPARGAIPFVSTVTGRREEALDAGYWYRNIREPVRFHAAVRELLGEDWRTFVEVGPHPVLARELLAAQQAGGARGAVIETLRRGTDEQDAVLTTLGRLFCEGFPVAATVEPTPPIDLPRYPFQRRSFWSEDRAGRKARIGRRRHPHLDELRPGVSSPDTFTCTVRIDPRREPYVRDHTAQGMLLFPAAGHLEIVLAAAAEKWGPGVFLEDVTLRMPLVLKDDDDPLELRLEVHSDEGHWTLSSRPSDDAPWTVHSTGRINHTGTPFPRPVVDVAGARERLATRLDAALLYEGARRAGLVLGPAFRGLTDFQTDGDEMLGRAEIPEMIAWDAKSFRIHPAVFDNLFTTSIIGSLVRRKDEELGRLYLPAGVEKAIVHQPFHEGPLWVHARQLHFDADSMRLDVCAVDEAGEPVATLRGLVGRYVKGSRDDRATTGRYAPRWSPAPPVPAETVAPGTWVVLADRQGVADRVERALTGAGNRVVRVRPDADLQQVAAEAKPVAGVVHLWTLDEPETTPEATRRCEALGPAALATLVGTFGEAQAFASGARLWLVTHRAQAVRPGEAPWVQASGLWGTGRVVCNEVDSLATALVDVGDPLGDAAVLADLLLHAPVVAEQAIRDGERLALRLEPAEVPVDPKVLVDTRVRGARALARTEAVLGSVALCEIDLPEPGPREILLKLRASSLNFRDIVIGTGMITFDAATGGYFGTELGMDCAGDVLAIGSEVRGVRVGQRVVALARHALATHAVVGEPAYCVPLPDAVSYEQGAALPIVYLTARVALEDLARVERGETVLVHAGAGGTGIAAIQIAKRLGARVFATTSTPEKVAFVRSLGVEEVFDSRSPTFRAKVMEVTGGQGVDVVLNSLSGRAWTESVRCLARFGRFVEIGKRDLYENRQVGLRLFAENVSLHVLDVNRWIVKHPEKTGRILAEALADVAEGRLPPHPLETFPLTRVTDALRSLAKGKHIGKVVVKAPEEDRVEAISSGRVRLDPKGAYVVSGGLGGFGLELASWLGARGAGHVVLLGRSGLRGFEEQARVAELEASGVRVTVRACDVADRDAVRAIVREVGPVRGVFHLAMVLDDAPLGALTPERFAAVSRPKVDGAFALHEATLGEPVEHFVLFSSIASVVGTPGQGNYAAANAFLDAFADLRRAQGRPCTAIGWGVVDVGVVARASEAQRKRFLAQGVRALTGARALAELDSVLLEAPIQGHTEAGPAHVVLADVDWGRVVAAGGSRARRFGHLAGERAVAAGEHGDLRAHLLSLEPAARLEALTARLVAFVAEISGANPAEIDAGTRLSQVGLDSLMGTQLQSWVQAELEVEVSLVRLLGGPAIGALAAEIEAAMREAGGEGGFRWLAAFRPVEAPVARLVCFPPMAGDRHAFDAFTHELLPGVDAVVLQLPELGAGQQELVTGPPEAGIAKLVEALAPLLDVPCGFYGHSMGGWIALELAKELVARTGTGPSFVAVGALPRPEVMAAITPSASAPEEIGDDFVLDVCRRLDLPSFMVDEPAVRERTLQRVRRDLWMLSRGDWTGPVGRFDVPVRLFVGASDPVDAIRDGRVRGIVPAEVVVVPGSHLFHAEPEGAKAVTARLNAAWAVLLGQVAAT